MRPLRSVGVVLLTALASDALYWLCWHGLVAGAVLFLGKSPHCGVALGISLRFTFALFVFFSAAVPAVCLLGAGRTWRRGTATLLALLALPPLAYWGVRLPYAPNWSLVVLVSTLVGLALPNLLACRWRARRQRLP